MTEYRVVWQFREDGPNPIFSAPRERIYKTFKGVQKRVDLLNSNGGLYTRYYDTEYGEESYERYRLVYCRLEQRRVESWEPHESR